MNAAAKSPAASHERAGFTQGQIRLAMFGLMLTIFLAALDQTIVATALGTIGEQLGDLKNISWVVSIYLLTSTATTPIYGKLSDMYGRRPLMLASLSIFTLASVLCAIAPTMWALIAARALQGVGGGGLMALSHASIADMISPRERGRWQGYVSSAFAGGNVLGPVLGGVIAQHASWPWIFWLNLPFCALAIVMVHRTLRLLPKRDVRHRIDWAGSTMFVAAIACVIAFLVIGGNDVPWSDLRLWCLLLAALVLAACFIARQRTAAEPILPLRLFGNPVFTTAVSYSFLASGTLVGSIVLFPLYLTFGRGYTASQASLTLGAITVTTVISSMWTGIVVARTGRYKIFPVVGLALATLSLLCLALLATHEPGPIVLALAFALVGSGIGLSLPVALVATQNAVEMGDLGIATSCVSFFRSFGGAVHVALFTAIVAIVLAAHAMPEVVGTHRGLDLLSVAGDQALVARACRYTFAVATCIMALATACAIMLPERPLRGSMPPAQIELD